MADICVLTGGRSLERAVALRGAARVERALRALEHEPTVIDMGPDLVPRLLASGHDAAFICAHGPGGEDGSLQELCELMGLPYTGSGPSTSIRCFDKVLLKHELRAAAIPTPDWASFSNETINELGAGQALDAAIERLGLPLVVKPARMGSALGVSVARDEAGLRAALVTALSFDGKVVVEQFRERARDLAVSILDEAGSPRPLPLVEAIPRGRELYDFEARYTPGMTEFSVPAAVTDEVEQRARALALRAAAALDVRAPARVDFVLSEPHGLEAIDLPTVPGMTETSLLPMAAEAAGVDFEQLVADILEGALTPG